MVFDPASLAASGLAGLTGGTKVSTSQSSSNQSSLNFSNVISNVLGEAKDALAGDIGSNQNGSSSATPVADEMAFGSSFLPSAIPNTVGQEDYAASANSSNWTIWGGGGLMLLGLAGLSYWWSQR